jgi:iron(III) transport system ATP-binding protein
MSALAINEVGLRLGTADVLKNVSLQVPPARIGAVLGPPLSGKTALLRAIAGLEHPHTGSIRIGERVMFDAATGIELPAQTRGVGMMFGSLALAAHWTVFDNVALGARFRGGDAAAIRGRVAAALTQTGIVELAQHCVEQLTHYEQWRVAIARALAGEPAVLLLDDPLAGFDETARAEARTWLKQVLTETGVTTLLATANRGDALTLAGRVALINGGAIEQEGTPAELHEQPATAFAASFMGAANRIEGTLVEKAGTRAFIEIMGVRIGGVARTQTAVGDKATGIIRVDGVKLGGGPGTNRIAMKLKAQMYLGERWELVFVRETLTVRAYASAPLRHEDYHVEFPSDALWIY